MKVLFISHEASRTGAPLALLSVLKAIHDGNNDIIPDVLLMEGGALEPDFNGLATIVHLKKRKRLWQRFKRKFSLCDEPYSFDYRQLKKESYDCIFANSTVALSTAAKLKQELGCPLILNVHESSFLLQSSVSDTGNLFQCDKLIAVSDAVKKDLVDYYGVDERKISVVWPPTELNATPILTPAKKTNDIIIGMSGSGGWYKGLDLVPLVIKDLTIRHAETSCHFKWVGGIPDEDLAHLKFDIERLGLTDKLTLTGNIDNPIEHYRNFDIFLLLSRGEAFSLACLENILLGVPIVCMKDSTGIVNMIGDDAAVTVSYLSIHEISDALYRLSINPDYRNSVASVAMARLKEKYSKQKSIEAILNEIRTFNLNKQQ